MLAQGEFWEMKKKKNLINSDENMELKFEQENSGLERYYKKSDIVREKGWFVPTLHKRYLDLETE